MRQAAARAARSRRKTVARPPGPADLRQRLRRSLDDVGRAHEDDPERVPPDALAEGGAGSRRQADGRILLRRVRGPASRLYPPADEVTDPRRRAQSASIGAGSITNVSAACARRNASTAWAGSSARA